MQNITALLVTLFLGIFIFIGAIIAVISRNNEKFVQFAISAACAVMILLGVFEIVPESFEILKTKYSTTISVDIILVCTLIGVTALIVLDKFIPDHDEGEDASSHFYHIGFISCVALIIHNIIEGIAVYSTMQTSAKLGIMVCIGVGLHNIPLGMVITSAFYDSGKNKKTSILMFALICLSTFFGGLLMFLFKIDMENNFILGMLLSIAFGMLMYISIWELLPKITANIKKKETLAGLVSGALLFVISIFI